MNKSIYQFKEYLESIPTKLLKQTEHCVYVGVHNTIYEISQKLKDIIRAGYFRSTTTTHSGWKPLIEGVRSFMLKSQKEENPLGKIHILGDQKVNDGTWRLRFFEGTKQRRNKVTVLKPNGRKSIKRTGNKGRLRDFPFFEQATTNSDLILNNNIERQLKKIDIN